MLSHYFVTMLHRNLFQKYCTMNVYLPKLGLGPFCYSIVMDSSWETCPFFFVVVIVYSMHSVLFNLSSWIFVNQEFTLRHESRRQNIELCHWILKLAFNYIFSPKNFIGRGIMKYRLFAAVYIHNCYCKYQTLLHSLFSCSTQAYSEQWLLRKFSMASS